MCDSTDFHRNFGWDHLECHDIISMPDKWEFPWVSTKYSFCLLIINVKKNCGLETS